MAAGRRKKGKAVGRAPRDHANRNRSRAAEAERTSTTADKQPQPLKSTVQRNGDDAIAIAQNAPTDATIAAEKHEDRYLHWDRGFAWLIAVATAIQTIVVGVQSCEMRRQGNLSNTSVQQTEKMLEGSRLEQRAWLTALGADITFSADQPVEGFVLVKNTGRTPAVIRNGAIDIWFASPEEHLSEKFEEYQINSAKMSARNTPLAAEVQTHLYLTETFTLDKHRFDAVMTGDLSMCIFGSFVYTDVWGDEHPLAFVMRYMPVHKTWIVDRVLNIMK